MKDMLKGCENLTYANTTVKIMSSLDDENLRQIEALADELCGEIIMPEVAEEASTKKKFVCKLCGYVHEADELPADFVCPICGSGADEFVEVSE